jgi:tetratricopeptide (TPR) repeat protein
MTQLKTYQYYRHCLKQGALALALTLCLGGAVPVFAAAGTIEGLSYQSAQKSLQIQSNGTIKPTLNTIMVQGNQRIILDLENAEIGLSMPRDAVLQKDLQDQGIAVTYVSVNQFGGQTPVVRIVLDLQGESVTPTLAATGGQSVVLRLDGASSSRAPLPTVNGAAPVPNHNQQAQRTIQDQQRRLLSMQQKLDHLSRELAVERAKSQATSNYTVEDLKRTLIVLNQRYDDLNRENQQLRQKLESPQSAPATSSSHNDDSKLRAENTQLSRQVQQLSTQTRTLQTKLEAAEKATAPSMQEIHSLKGRLEKADQALNEAMGTIERQNSEIGNLQENLTRVQNDISANAREQLTVLNDKLELKEAEVMDLQKKMSRMATTASEATALEQQFQDKLKAVQSSHQEETNRLKKAMLDQDHLIEQLNQQLAQTQGVQSSVRETEKESQALQAELDKMQQALVTMNARYEAVMQERDSLKHSVQKLEQNTASVQADKTALRQEKEQEKQALEKALKDIRAREADLATLAQEKQALEQALKDMRARETDVATLAQEKQALEQALKDMRENKAATVDAEAQRYVAQIDRIKVDHQRELQRLEEELKAQDQALNELNRQLEDQVNRDKREGESQDEEKQSLLKTVSTLQQENASLRADVTQWRQQEGELQTLRKQLEQTQQALKKAEEKAKVAAQKAPSKPAQEQDISTHPEYQDMVQEIVRLKQALHHAAAGKESQVIDAAEWDRERTATQALIQRQSAEIVILQDKLRQVEAQKQSSTGNAKEVDRLNKALAEQSSKLAHVEQQLETATQKASTPNQATEAELASLKKRYEDTRKEATLLRTQLNSIASVDPQALEKKDKELKAALKQVDLLQTKLSEQQQVAKAKGSDDGAVMMSAMETSDHLEAEQFYAKGKDTEKQGNLVEAINAYEKAVSLAPNASKFVFALSSALMMQHRYMDAARTVQEFIDRDPNNRDAYSQLGKAFLLDGKIREASQAFSMAIPASSLSNYATSLKKLGRMKEAESVLKLALQMTPEDGDLLFNLGNLYNTQDNLMEAQKAYIEALRINPEFAEAHYNLGLLYTKKGERDSALHHLQTYLQLAPNAANRKAIESYISKLRG